MGCMITVQDYFYIIFMLFFYHFIYHLRGKASVHSVTKCAAATVGENQSETPIPSTRHLIGSRQRLLQSVAQCVGAIDIYIYIC